MAMLAIQGGSNTDACTVNVLPCRIHHDGSVKVGKRHWQVTKDKDDSKTAYFRGRKLKGSSVRMPDDYKGLIVKSTDKLLTPLSRPTLPSSPEDSDIDEEEVEEPVKILEGLSEIKEIIVWDHDQLPAADDAFMKGVDEFIQFADAIHS